MSRLCLLSPPGTARKSESRKWSIQPCHGEPWGNRAHRWISWSRSHQHWGCPCEAAPWLCIINILGGSRFMWNVILIARNEKATFKPLNTPGLPRAIWKTGSLVDTKANMFSHASGSCGRHRMNLNGFSGSATTTLIFLGFVWNSSTTVWMVCHEIEFSHIWSPQDDTLWKHSLYNQIQHNRYTLEVLVGVYFSLWTEPD